MEVMNTLLKMEHNAAALSEYQMKEFLGKGGFAHVYLAEHKFEKRLVAVKIYSKEDSKSSKPRTESLRRESDLFRMLRHPQVLSFTEFKETSTHIFIILEYCNGGDIWAFLERRKKLYPGTSLDPKVVANIVKLLLKALSHLHSKNMIHRDIKPGTKLFTLENILVQTDEMMNITNVKLGDLGLCVHLENPYVSKLTSRCGTVAYMAPELLKRDKYTEVAIPLI